MSSVSCIQAHEDVGAISLPSMRSMASCAHGSFASCRRLFGWGSEESSYTRLEHRRGIRSEIERHLNVFIRAHTSAHNHTFTLLPHTRTAHSEDPSRIAIGNFRKSLIMAPKRKAAVAAEEKAKKAKPTATVQAGVVVGGDFPYLGPLLNEEEKQVELKVRPLEVSTRNVRALSHAMLYHCWVLARRRCWTPRASSSSSTPGPTRRAARRRHAASARRFLTSRLLALSCLA